MSIPSAIAALPDLRAAVQFASGELSTADVMDAAATHAFLHRVLPENGLKVVVEFNPSRPPTHHFYRCHEAAARQALELDALGRDVYFACATFKTDASRKSDNAGWMKSFWIDVDVAAADPGKYASQLEAIRDIGRVCKELDLPLPLLVKSGGGLHAYWPLTEEIDADTWRHVARRFKATLHALGFKQDRARTADAASVLRPVGTHWRKSGERVVEQVHNGEPIPLQRFVDALAKFEHAPTAVAAASNAGDSLPTHVDDLIAGATSDPTAPYPYSDQRENFRSALRAAIPNPVDRNEWRIGELSLAYLAVRHAWPEEEAKKLLDEWSKLAPGADTSNNDRDWADALKRTRERVAAGDPSVTTHLSVLKLARKAGWSPSRAPSTGAPGVDTPGDILNARMFAMIFRDALRYVHRKGVWLQWTGTHWQACQAGEEMEYAKKGAGIILEHCIHRAKELGDDAPRAKRLIANALRAQKEAGLLSMIRLASSEPSLRISDAEQLDADPMLLGVQNGVVDLRSGALLQPSPDMLITRQCGSHFDRGAQAPRWIAFQREITGGDDEMLRYKQRALGYCLTGIVREEKLFFAFGLGANGKSVEANILSAVFGDYVVQAPAAMFAMRRSNDGPRNDVARLAGARLVLANETQSGDRLDEQLVKTLVSRERITARFLHREYFEFTPTFKILMRGNHKPIVTGDDLGIWRRIDLWPYEQTFEGERADPELETKLLEERPGILNWLVDGYLEYQRIGLAPPGAVKRASASYRDECDVLGDYLTTECVQQPGLFVGQQALYTNYKEWCLLNSYRPLAKGQLTRKLAERGIKDGRRTVLAERLRTYEGVCPNACMPALASLARM